MIPLATVWAPDTTLRLGTQPGVYEADTSALRLTLAGWPTGRPTMVVWHPSGARATWRGIDMAWRMQDSSRVLVNAPTPTNVTSYPSQDCIRGIGALGTADEEYQVEGGRIKHAFVLPSGLVPPPGATHLEITGRLALSGCDVGPITGLTAGGVPLFSAVQPEPVMHIERGEAWDSAGHRTHVAYEWQVVVQDGVPDPRRVDLTMLVDALWLAQAEGTVIIDPTVTTSTSSAATGYSNARLVGWFSSNGVRVAVVNSGSNAVLRYSADGGQSWLTPAVGATIGAYTQLSIRVRDGYIWLVAVSGSSIVYLRATPNASYTEFTWSAQDVVVSVTNAGYPDLEVINTGSGWLLVAVYSTATSTPNNYARAAVLTILASGAPSGAATLTTLGGSYSVNVHTTPSIHRDDPGNVYVGWSAGGTGSGKGTWFIVGTRSAGAIAWGTAENITTSYYPGQFGSLSVAATKSGTRWYAGLRYSSSVYCFMKVSGGAWAALPTISAPATYGNGVALTIHDDDVFCTYAKDSAITQRYSVSGGAWGAVQVLNSTSTAQLVNARPETDGGSVDVLLTTGSASSYTAVFEQLTLNTAPQAPSGLTRANYDATEAAAYTWKHNDTDAGDSQSAYQLQIRLNGAGADLVDTGYVSSPTSSHSLAGGTLTNGNTYQWRVRTKDQAGVESPWSDYATVQAGANPVAVTAKWYLRALRYFKPDDWTTSTIKVALCTSTYTPDQDTHDYFNDVTNEVAGAGYLTGGATLASKTVTEDAVNNRIVLDAADVQWANSTISARYAVFYVSTGTASTSLLLGYVDFGPDPLGNPNWSSFAGNFDLAWSASGILRLTAS